VELKSATNCQGFLNSTESVFSAQQNPVPLTRHASAMALATKRFRLATFWYTTSIPHMAKERKKDPAAVALGRKGGLKGGKARMALLSSEERTELARKAGTARASKLTPAERSELARKAIAARWSKLK